MSERGQVDINFLQTLYRYLSDELNRLTVLRVELERSKETLRALSSASGDEVGPLIIPVSTHLSLIVEAAKAKEVLLLLGGNVFAKVTPEKAIDEIDRMLEEVNKSLEEVKSNLTRIQLQLEAAQRRVTGKRAQKAGG